MRWSQVLLCSLLLVGTAGCHKVLGLEEFDTEDTALFVYDTETEEGRDYWVDGYCPLITSATSAAEPVRVSTDCRGIGKAGCCDSQGHALYCNLGRLYCLPCFQAGYSCGWSTQERQFFCVDGDTGGDVPLGLESSCSALETTSQ